MQRRGVQLARTMPQTAAAVSALNLCGASAAGRAPLLRAAHQGQPVPPATSGAHTQLGTLCARRAGRARWCRSTGRSG